MGKDDDDVEVTDADEKADESKDTAAVTAVVATAVVAAVAAHPPELKLERPKLYSNAKIKGNFEEVKRIALMIEKAVRHRCFTFLA